MENQTAFDLNRAIQSWRENLAQSPAFERENLNELESHLRDSVATLQSRGLSTEEAFIVATKRIGQGGALEKEFGKVNGGAVWLDRFLWMLLGLQAWCVILSISNLVGNILSPLAQELKGFLGFGAQNMPEGFVRNMVLVICSPMQVAVVVALVLWRSTRRKKSVADLVQKSLTQPWVLAGGLFATCVVLRLFAILALRYWYFPMISVTRESVQWQFAPQVFMYIPAYLILAGLTLLIARRRLHAVTE